MAYRKTRDVKAQLAEKRALILHAATEIAAEEGLDAVQMRLVAERAGIALGGIYLHFADAGELHGYVIAHYLRDDLDAIDAVDTARPATDIAMVIAVLIDRSRRRKGGTASITSSPAYRSRITRALCDRLAKLDTVEDPEVIALAIYGALDAILQARTRYGTSDIVSLLLRTAGVAPATAASIAQAMA